MANAAYQRRDVARCPVVKIEAGSSETVITKTMGLNREDSREFALFFQADNVNVSGSEIIEACLQEMVASDVWCDVGEVASVCIDQDGRYAIKLSEGVELEALVLPLSNPIRLVVKTGGSSTLELSEVQAVRGWV